MPELKFGLTATAQCSYLVEQTEQLVFLLPEQPVTDVLYQQLLQLNFRRSGEQVYTPHCPACRACQSVRISPSLFTPGRSQRRLLNKAQRHGWQYRLTNSDSTDYYPLFAEYISQKHADGSMYPPDHEHLLSMLHCSWLKVNTFELYYQQKLAAVTIVDQTENALSAVYTFYQPQLSSWSPGRLAILYLIQQALTLNKDWLYLGYQIDSCKKMAYKAQFLPQQRFIDGNWHSFG